LPATAQAPWRSAARETCFAKRLPHPVGCTNYLKKPLPVSGFFIIPSFSPRPVDAPRYTTLHIDSAAE